MADNVTIPATGTGDATPVVATDQVAVNGGSVAHAQYVKLVDGTSNGTAGLPGDAANGLDVDVTRVGGTVTVAGTVAISGTVTTADNQTLADNAAFTDGTSKVMPSGYIFDEVAGTALTENDVAAARLNANRAQVLVIEDDATRGRRTTVTAANALKVDNSAVTQPVSGTVTANAGTGPFPVSDNAGSLTVDAPVATPVAVRLSDGAAFISALPITDNAGSLTVDQATGTNLHTVVDSGTITTVTNVVHVDDNAGSITVDQATGTNLHTVLDSGTLSTITNVVHVDDNAGSLTVDAPVGTPAFVRLSDGAAALTTTSGRLAVDGSGVIQPVSGTVTVTQGTGTNLHTVIDSGTITTVTGITNVVHVDDNAGSLTVDSPQMPAALGQGTMAQGMKVTLASDQTAIPVTNTGTFAVQPSNVGVDGALTEPSVGLAGGWDPYMGLRSANVRPVEGVNKVMVFDSKVRAELAELKIIMSDIRNLLMNDSNISVSPPKPQSFTY